MNQALLTKVGWRLTQNDSGLWCKLLKRKYLNSRNFFDLELNKGAACSSTWKAVAFGAGLINKGLKWRVVSGELIRFWINDLVSDVGVLQDHGVTLLLKILNTFYGVTGSLVRFLFGFFLLQLCGLFGNRDIRRKREIVDTEYVAATVDLVRRKLSFALLPEVMQKTSNFINEVDVLQPFEPMAMTPPPLNS
ncbi:hypothetical protein Ddye_011827 [Dipteronia dyeriana]|uniref:Uncharacterized protein n=1 Tax=Dipteronia dyeriana TaxID=168575 RepID=A0AAE0CHP0_9ROSI|nr:hypothetical protein Ddye_011827 [Dipteronia dyeriana]